MRIAKINSLTAWHGSLRSENLTIVIAAIIKYKQLMH
jgi:hypothetical protein